MTTPYRKKLIEVALPLEAINREAAREKSIRHGHPSTLHLWWARRPLAACRAVLFASLVDDPSEYVAELLKDSAKRKAAEKELKARKKLWDEMSAVLEKAKAGGISAPAPGLPAEASAQAGPEPKLEDIIAEIERERLFEIIRQLVKWENSNNERVLNAARAEIMRSCNGNLPAPRPACAGRPGLFFVYAIECDDGSHYIGQTDDLQRRWMEHVEGRGADWTKRHKPVRVAHWEEFNSREEAVKREHDLKTGFGRKWLKDLIASGRARQAGPPPVYDPFCGGGSIPLEAQRLGLEAHASDLNPVPVLINKALIEIPPKFAGKPPVNPEARGEVAADVSRLKSSPALKESQSRLTSAATGTWKGAAGLAEDIRYYGQWMRDEAEKRIGHLYPKVKLPKEHGGGDATVIAWLWTRTVKCPNPACGAQMPLASSLWLSTKGENKSWAEPVIDSKSKTISFNVKTGQGQPPSPPKLGRGAKFKCLVCQQSPDGQHIKDEGAAGRMETQLMAIVADGPKGRVYLSPNSEQANVAKQAKPEWQPDQPLANDPRNLWCIPYGLRTFGDLFTKRQLVALTTLSGLVLEARDKALKDSNGDSEYANAVAIYLGLSVSRTSNTICSLAVWSQGRDQSVNVFSRQALPMNWDFPEVNPFAGAAGDFAETSASMAKTVAGIAVGKQGFVDQCDATRVNTDGSKWVFCTDPPYYDNVGYADLSDFFYVWLRASLSQINPKLFSTLLVPKTDELISAPHRFDGDGDKAKNFFEVGLGKAFKRVRELQSEQFPFTVYYAFKQSEAEESGENEDDDSAENSHASTGWETMLEGLLKSGFSINGTWPMRTERPTGVKRGTNVLASSIILVCHPREKDAGVASRRDFLAALKRELPEALRHLQKGNIAPVDLAQAAIGPGMAVFSRYAKVLETDGSTMSVRSALTEINKCLDEVLAEQEGEFDADTRWALAWFDQNGFAEGAYGVAETLCTAKNTSVQGMKDAGILEAKGGKVRLLKKEELDADWPACRLSAKQAGTKHGAGRNPATDSRLTIWEITHHLIRRLEQGESGAAELIQQLGAKAEVARDLSYRLYTICERRKWAQEAIAYNALVLSWSDVQRLAEERKAAATPTQGELI